MDLFLEQTPHAKPPADDSSQEWVNFGIAQTGQLNLSNRDKELAHLMLQQCELEGEEALARARRALRPWYRKIL